MNIEVEGFDASIWDEPIGRIIFIADYDEFDYDEEYMLNRQGKVRENMKEYTRLLKKEYNKNIALANEAFNNKSYDLAEELYKKAINYNHDETHAKKQLNLIEQKKQNN